MSRFKRTTAVVSLLLSLGLFIACQNNPMGPSQKDSMAPQVQLVPVNPQHIGLAKGVHSQSRMITVNRGGFLGGIQTAGNFVYIPPNTLQENLFLTFTLSTDNNTLIFEIEARGHDGQVNFQDGESSYLAVRKDWLAEAPDVIYNPDTGEVYDDVQDAGFYWIAQVPHFSIWAWGILD